MLTLQNIFLKESREQINFPKFIQNYEKVSPEKGLTELRLTAGMSTYGFIIPKYAEKRIWLEATIDISKLHPQGTDSRTVSEYTKELSKELKDGTIDPIFIEVNERWSDSLFEHIPQIEIIDGNHRIKAAKNLGVEKLPGYVIMPIGWKEEADLKESSRFVKIYRALPLSASTIRTNDYVTLSKKFAIEHAITSAIYHDEDYQVTQKLVKSDKIKNANNPGEYKYIGPETTIKPLYIIDRDGEIHRSNLREEIDYDEYDIDCPKEERIKPPFNIWHDFANYDILVFKTSPEYNKGSIEEINLEDPNLFATQRHICLPAVKKYEDAKKFKKLPVVIKFENGLSFIQDGHHRLSALKLNGASRAKAYVIYRDDADEILEEELIKKSGGIRYFQMGSSLPDNLYNRKNGKSSDDPGVGKGGKRSDSAKQLEKERKNKEKKGKEWYAVNENIFSESVVDVDQLPDDIKVKINPNISSGFEISITNNNKTYGEITTEKSEECTQAYVVKSSESIKGYGPLLYDIAMEYAGNYGLTSDRDTVSQDASKVWEYYFKKRKDIVKKEIDPKKCSIHASTNTGSSIKSFGDVFKRKTKRPWLNFVYYAPQGTIINKLEKKGIITNNFINEGVSVATLDGALEMPPRYWDSGDSPRINKKSRKEKEEFYKRLYIDVANENQYNYITVYVTDPEYYRSKAIAQNKEKIPDSKPFYNNSKSTTEFAGVDPRSGLEIRVITNDSSLIRSKAIVDYILQNKIDAREEPKKLSLKEIFYPTESTYFHGTTAELKPGDYILPPNETGKMSEKGRKRNLDKVFFTKDVGSAKVYAGRAKHSLGGVPKIYIVEPIGKIETINNTPGTTVLAAPKAKVIKLI